MRLKAKHVMKFLERRRQEKLYKQWTEYAELPAEAIPPLALEIPDEVREWGVAEESGFYRFRDSIVDMVKKLLRVD